MYSDAAAKGPLKDVHRKAVEAVTRAPHPDDSCEDSAHAALRHGAVLPRARGQASRTLVAHRQAPRPFYPEAATEGGSAPSAFPKNTGAKPLGALRQEPTGEPGSGQRTACEGRFSH